MEKFLLVLLCVLPLLVSGTIASRRHGLKCNKSSDCSRDQCCLSNTVVRGKREVPDSTTGGTCRPLGGISAGDGMVTVLGRCPCKQGLICRGSGVIEVPLGETGIHVCIGGAGGIDNNYVTTGVCVDHFVVRRYLIWSAPVGPHSLTLPRWRAGGLEERGEKGRTSLVHTFNRTSVGVCIRPYIV